MIDGAHNNESIQVLVDILQSTYADKEIHILFAAIEGKPVTTMLEMLNQFTSLTVTSFQFPMAIKAEAYPKGYNHLPSWQDWLERVEEDGDKLYVITGSLYFISEIRQALVGWKKDFYGHFVMKSTELEPVQSISSCQRVHTSV